MPSVRFVLGESFVSATPTPWMGLLDWFSHFFTWMQGLSPLWAYVTLFVIAYGENVAPPIPGDMVVVFGGYLAGIGQLHLGVVIVLSTIGGALGFMTMFELGRRLGRSVFTTERRWIPQEGFEKARRWLQRYGYGVIAANRFLSGARSVISLTAGVARMEPWRTFGWCTVSAFVWTGLISYAGYAVGENWTIVVTYIRAYGRVILTLLVLAGVIFLARWAWRRSATDAEGKESEDLE